MLTSTGLYISGNTTETGRFAANNLTETGEYAPTGVATDFVLTITGGAIASGYSQYMQ